MWRQQWCYTDHVSLTALHWYSSNSLTPNFPETNLPIAPGPPTSPPTTSSPCLQLHLLKHHVHLLKRAAAYLPYGCINVLLADLNTLQRK